MSTETQLSTRREVLAGTAAAGAASLVPMHVAAAVPGQPSGEADSSMGKADDNTIRPFRFHATDAALSDLRRRIGATKWPSRELVAGCVAGRATRDDARTRALLADDYDWRRFEAKLNALPQFVTRSTGVDIHFIHVRSKHPNALPIIVTHGWPGSIIEQLKIIDPLTNPTAHGGARMDAFDVVIPSLPGQGFPASPPPSAGIPFGSLVRGPF